MPWPQPSPTQPEGNFSSEIVEWHVELSHKQMEIQITVSMPFSALKVAGLPQMHNSFQLRQSIQWLDEIAIGGAKPLNFAEVLVEVHRKVETTVQ